LPCVAREFEGETLIFIVNGGGYLAFNWFFAIVKGSKIIFEKRTRPVTQVIQILPTQPESEDRKKEDEEANQQLNDLAKYVKKLESRQDEIVMAVEDLTDGLDEHKEITSEAVNEREKEIAGLISAMITAADYTEDFFHYAKESGNHELYEQASFFWNAINKKFSAVGLVRINDLNTHADAVFNTIVSAEVSDEITKPGIIIKTLRSGYVYHGKVIRKSEVVVTRSEGDSS